MKFNITKQWLLKATHKEDTLAVSAGQFTFDMLAPEAEDKAIVVAEVPAFYQARFGQLINLRRREQGLTLEELACASGIDLLELVSIEQVPGYSPTPHTLGQIAAVLKLPKNRLLQLANSLAEEEKAFSLESDSLSALEDSVKALTLDEKQTLDAYVGFLNRSEEA